MTITAKAGKTTKTVDMEVKTMIFKDVKQTKADTLEAVIVGDTASLKAENIAIKNTSNNISYAVKSVAVDKADKTKVTITTFAQMNDGKEYSVTIADTTKTITATDNKIAAVTVTPVTVPYATLTTISAIATDAQGVVLAEQDYNNQANVTIAGKTAEFTITPAAGGYTNGAQLYLAKKGDVAKAKVTIKSGEYDTTGKEINNIDSGEVAITAGDQETVTVSDFKARVSLDKTKSYDEVKDNTSLAIGDEGCAYFKITNSKEKEIATADYSNYKVESSNSNVLVIAAGTLSPASGSKKGSSAVNVYGVSAGTAYLVVKDTKNKDAVVATIPVTVNAKRAVSSLSLDRTSFVLSTSTAVDAEKVNITVKDQYDEKMTSNYTVKAELLSSPSGATTVSAPTVTPSTTAITFETASSNAKTGTYTYKVTVTDANDSNVTRSQVITVEVKAPTGTAAYAFEIAGLDANNTVDTTLNEKFAGAKDVTIKVVKTLGGVKDSYVSAENVTLKKDNKDVTIATAAADTTATFAAIATNSANIATAAAAGTYVVNGTVSDNNKTYTVAPVTFIVKNDTAKVTAAQTKDTIAAGTVDLTSLLGSFDFYFGATKLDSSALTFVSAKAAVNGAKEASLTTVTAGNVVFITEVVVTVKFDGTNSFQVTVPVNKAVTGK